jgi:hypothetical protein
VARSKVRRPSGRSDPQPTCRDHRQRERVLDIKIKSSPRYHYLYLVFNFIILSVTAQVISMFVFRF